MIHEKWFDAIKPMLAKWIEPKDWELLSNFEQSLNQISQDEAKNSPLQAKTLLASQGYGMMDVATQLGGKGRSPLFQALIQFLCGYHNLDYRDIAHVGHGKMIVLHGSEKQRKLWIPKINSGSLVGIAATEEQGGSRVQSTKTIAKRYGKTYLLTGEKHCISRLKEASVFVVFFKFEQDETLSAALVKPSCRGFKTELWEPMGLCGWSWGRVTLENVPITDQDVLGVRGQGMAIFKEHFVYYRPMVAITALGTAASVLDKVLAHINMRISRRDLSAPRDTALGDIADHYFGINGAILSTMCTLVQVVENTPHSSLWSRGNKAWSVEQAYDAVSKLALLMGAVAFKKDHFVAKALCDLRGLLLADGIHDALRRSSGRALMGFL